MKHEPPIAIPLTEEEKSLLGRISFDHTKIRGGDFQSIMDAACELAKSLLRRSGIPGNRLAYFIDPALNIGVAKSRKEVFEANGTRGEDILRHPHFLKHLQYFICGPDLPASSIEGFCQTLNDDSGTSGMMLDQLKRFVRAEVRKERLEKSRAAEEFFKLSHELGLDEHFCRTIRDAARTAQ
jgi:hypothetical protein